MLYNLKNTNEVRNVWYTQTNAGEHSLHQVLKTYTLDFKLICSVYDFLILSTAPISLPLRITDMQ